MCSRSSCFPGQPWSAEMAVIRCRTIDRAQQVQALDDCRRPEVKLPDKFDRGGGIASAKRVYHHRDRLGNADGVRNLDFRSVRDA